MKVDIIYPLANQSKDRDDWELRYSLRSMAAQDWVGNIYMIGHKPDWATGVTHVPMGDPCRAKDANIIRKILAVCNMPGVSPAMVVNSDDQYIMQKISLDELGPWAEDPHNLKHLDVKRLASRWWQRVVDTLDCCNKIKKPQWVFEAHIPYLIDVQAYKKHMTKLPWNIGNGLTTHIYFNMVETEGPPRPLEGLVFRNGRQNDPDVIDKLAACTFFNHNNAGLTQEVKGYLAQHFPQPSPWEVV